MRASVPPDRESEAPLRPSMPSMEAPHHVFVDYVQRGRVSIVLAILVVLGTTIYLHAPVARAVVGGTNAYFEWDVPEQYWPDLVYLCGALHREHSVPYWNPYDRGGYPFYADPQAATFHPLTWAICAIGGPAPGLSWATFRVVFGFLCAGLFGLLWLRRVGAPWSGAILGAVLIEAAPFMRHAWELNLSHGLAYLPLLLYAADRLAVGRRVFDGVLFAVALGLSGAVGSPPALWLAGSLTILYLAFRLGEEWREHGREVLRGGFAFSAAIVLSIGLLGVLLVPTTNLAALSVQAGRDLASIREGSLDPSEYAALIGPRPGNHLFVGWIALGLAPFALFRIRDRQAWFFAAAAGLAIAMVSGGDVFAFAFEWVPGVRWFRAPVRYEAWLGIAAATLAAFGLAVLQRWQARLAGRVVERGRGDTPALPREDEDDEVPATLEPRFARVARAIVRRRAALNVGARVGALGAVGGGVALLVVGSVTPGLAAIALGVVLLAMTLPTPWDIGAAPWGVVLAALALVDVTQALPPERHMRTGEPPGQDASIYAHAPHTRHAFRVMDEFAVGARSGTRTRHRDLRGYQDPLLLASYERVIGSLAQHPGLAPQFNVRYALQGPHFIHGWDRHFLPPPASLRSRVASRVVYEDEEERSVTELLDALPLAYFVPHDEVERADDRAAALDRVRLVAPSAVAILDGESDPHESFSPGWRGAATGRRPIAVGTDVRLDADGLRFSIDAPADGLVVVNEAYYPGWRATVDGDRTPIYRANALVRAVWVGEGSHTIEMRFRPDDGAYWREVYFFAFLLCFVGLLAPVSRRAARAVRDWRRMRAARRG